MSEVIDFHSHFYPASYIRELKQASPEDYGRVTVDREGREIIRYAGDYNVVVGPHVKLEERLTAMKKNGIDMQVLSLTTPGVERENDPERGIKLAKLANDEFGDISERHREKFCALASLPMQDPRAAKEELRRSVEDRGLKGGMLFSNANGVALDSENFLPIYAEAERLGVPLFLHPTTPINYSKALEDYRLVPIIGFTFDTALALLRLVFSGVFEKLPRLKIVIAHTGGVFPQLRGRIDIAYRAYPECRVNISKAPAEYLKKNVWIDTVCYDRDVFLSSYAFSGPERVVLGTDFPHQISDIERSVSRIKELDIGEEERMLIFSENARKLLKLQQ